MLIMCEVVSHECKTLPPPPSQLLSPKEKRKQRWGRAVAIQSKADLFKRCRLFIGMLFLDYFVLSTSWPFRLKVKVPKYPEKLSCPPPRNPALPKSWRLDSWCSERLFKKRWAVWLLLWFDDRVFIWTNHVRFSSAGFLRNGILLRRLQTLHWKLSKNGFMPPLSSLLLGCSTDVIIRVRASEKSSCSGCHPPFSHHKNSQTMNPLLSVWAQDPPHHAEEGMWTS